MNRFLLVKLTLRDCPVFSIHYKVVDRWQIPPVGPRNQAKDLFALRINSYHSLLTRGHDDLIVFVPPEPAMQSTYQALHSAGFELLKN